MKLFTNLAPIAYHHLIYIYREPLKSVFNMQMIALVAKRRDFHEKLPASPLPARMHVNRPDDKVTISTKIWLIHRGKLKDSES